MPILDIQRSMRELGRIRAGTTEEYQRNGQTRHRPAKLETWRMTSKSRELIEAAAALYGGTAAPWREGEWEVVTTAPALDVVIPPGQSLTQWYELWSAGGCQRRCDGTTNVLTMEPCLCPSDVATRVELAKTGGACKATTRLKVMLPALPDLGVWMLESHGYYAATELAGSAEILAMASELRRLVPARLRLERREKKIPGAATQVYFVPILELTQTRLADLPLALGDGAEPPRLGAAPGLPALPSTTLPITSDFRAPAEEGPAEISPDELRAGIRELGISEQAAVDRANELFAGRRLTGAERLALLERLRADEAARAAR